MERLWTPMSRCAADDADHIKWVLRAGSRYKRGRFPALRRVGLAQEIGKK